MADRVEHTIGVPEFKDEDYEDPDEAALVSDQDSYIPAVDTERVRRVELLVEEYFVAHPNQIPINYEQDIAIQMHIQPTPKAFGTLLMEKYGTGENIVAELDMTIEDIVAIFWSIAAQLDKLSNLSAAPTIDSAETEILQAVTSSKIAISNTFRDLQKASALPIYISEPQFYSATNQNYTTELPAILHNLRDKIARRLEDNVTLAQQLIWEIALSRKYVRAQNSDVNVTEPTPSTEWQQGRESAAISNMISHAIQVWAKRSKVFPKHLILEISDEDYENWRQGNYNAIPIPAYIDPKLEETIMKRRELSAEAARYYFWARIRKLDLQVKQQIDYELES